MGAGFSFELISIETYAPQFIAHNNFFLGSVFKQVMFDRLKSFEKCNFVHCK